MATRGDLRPRPVDHRLGEALRHGQLRLPRPQGPPARNSSSTFGSSINPARTCARYFWVARILRQHVVSPLSEVMMKTPRRGTDRWRSGSEPLQQGRERSTSPFHDFRPSCGVTWLEPALNRRADVQRDHGGPAARSGVSRARVSSAAPASHWRSELRAVAGRAGDDPNHREYARS